MTTPLPDHLDQPAWGHGGLSHKRTSHLPKFYFGSTYYPEHWDVATRATDGQRMAEAGFNIVRMAEFAWDRIEPVEGKLDFSLFDQTIAELGERGIDTLMCTPTATPPRWLTHAHPEILRCNADGVAMSHGSRQHVSHMHPLFRQHSIRITRLMAEHYRDNPHVIGWQTDNEMHCHFAEDHSEAARLAFVRWCAHKYDNDIARLNAVWGNAFWALTYNDFDQIVTPRPNKPTYLNPAHQLDYYRFLSDAAARFQRDQIEVLRTVQPKWWITHNGIMQLINYRGPFTQDLDVLGFDSYPMFDANPDSRPSSHAMALDRTRAWAGNFIIPEQQSGPGGQPPYFQDHPEPGELRQMTLRSVARGADSLIYFRWRTCRFGAEQYWCGILDHDNVPRRRYREVAQTGAEIRALQKWLQGTHVHVEAAVAGADFDAGYSHAIYALGLPSPDQIADRIYRHLFDARLPVGVIHPSDDLAGVKLYFIPHWTVFDPAWVQNLQRFVESGGTLVIGARTATRDVNNNIVPETVPGCLAGLAGVTVEEYGRQNRPEARPLNVCFDSGARVQSDLWYEQLQLGDDVHALAKWEGRHLDSQPAISLRRCGQGRVLYVGTYFTDELLKAMLRQLIEMSGVKPLWPDVTDGVEVVVRENLSHRIWFFINNTDHSITLRTAPAGKLANHGTRHDGGRLEIPQFGVEIVVQHCDPLHEN